jgi:hypothetical protein
LCCQFALHEEVQGATGGLGVPPGPYTRRALQRVLDLRNRYFTVVHDSGDLRRSVLTTSVTLAADEQGGERQQAREH